MRAHRLAALRALAIAALAALPLLGACRATPPACCARPCTTDSQCNPSLWGVCIDGCCACVPPDGGSCPAEVAPPAALPALDGGCP